MNGIYARATRPLLPRDDRLPVLGPDQAAPLTRAFFLDALRSIDAERQGAADVADLDLRRVELEDRYSRLVGSDDALDETFGAKVAVLRKAGLRSGPESEACNLLRHYIRRAMAQITAISLPGSGTTFRIA